MDWNYSRGQEIETDVVIVGYGGAGATAAITAHDNGARVIIVEKMPEGGGNTRLCSGRFQSPLSVKAVDHLRVLCSGMTEEEVIKAYVENAIKNKEWVEKLGGETQREVVLDVCYPRVPDIWLPNAPGAGDMASFHLKRGGNQVPGEEFWNLLSANVERRRIRVMTSAPAEELITNKEGDVVGVVVETGGHKIPIMARGAVILTCGGFEYSNEMKKQYLPCEPLYPTGHPGNTGDGIRMAKKVRADLSHMACLSGSLVFKSPDYEAGFSVRIFGNTFVLVNRDGKRFTNETALLLGDAWKAPAQFDGRRSCYPNIPAYAIFDEMVRRRGPLYQGLSGLNRQYRWSLDNSKEVSKGWIKKGQTIGELAKQILVDKSALENTIAKYNECCSLGKDPEFGRSQETLEPIGSPPYYAIELWPNVTVTFGGPRRDKKARVLDVEGKPIPRLYSAGELGSIWGRFPDPSCGLGEVLAFGRIAGRNAAAELP